MDVRGAGPREQFCSIADAARAVHADFSLHQGARKMPAGPVLVKNPDRQIAATQTLTINRRHVWIPGFCARPTSRGWLAASSGTVFIARKCRSTNSHTGSPVTPSRTGAQPATL